MNKKILIFPLIAAVVLLALFVVEREGGDPNIIRISGNIEITEVEVSFKIPGLVERRFVAEGEPVELGEQIASLDAQELEQKVALHAAEVEAAEAAFQELQGGYLPEEIAQAEAQLEQAEASYARLKADFDRQQQLFEGDVISSREFDASTSAFEVAEAKVKEARERLSMLKKGIRKEKIAQFRARLKQAEEALKLAKTQLGYATLEAPISGYVLSDNIEGGEYVVPGTPVVTIGDLDDVWLRGYIDESDLGKVKLGQRVEVTTDSYPGRVYPGRISFISPEAEFTPKNVQTEKERVKLVYRIKVEIPNPDQELKPGMPADGAILINDSNH